MTNTYALDFGTTNSVVARWNAQAATPEVVSLPGLSMPGSDGQPPVIPSLVYVNAEGAATLGQAVVTHGLLHQRDNRLFRNFKRGIVASTTVLPRVLDGTPWSERDASQAFLRQVLQSLPCTLAELDTLVLTVPVAAHGDYLTWLHETITGLGVGADTVRVVDESTAAALGYAVTEPGVPVLVFDFGGGTLDLSLVQLPERGGLVGGFLRQLLRGDGRARTARVIAKAGRVLGGSDVDHWLLDAVLARLGLLPEDCGDAYATLLTRCEQAKIALSTRASVAFDLPAGIGDGTPCVVTRAELEAVLTAHGFYEAIERVVDKVMVQARRQGVFTEDVHYVLMVGGTSLMPAVQALLARYFGAQAVHADKPFTAVAEGALRLAAGLNLDDFLEHSYALRYLDPSTQTQRYEELIPAGTRYPTTAPIEIALNPAHAAQAQIELVLGEVTVDDAALVEVVYENGQAVFVAQVRENDQRVVPLNLDAQGRAQTCVTLAPGGKATEARLVAAFSVDALRQLHVTVQDAAHKRVALNDVTLGLNGGEEAASVSSVLTGFEPQLATRTRTAGRHRLSPRNLAALLPTLAPGALTIEAAGELLRNDDFYVRYVAAEQLARNTDRAARVILQEALQTGTAPVRASVARQLHHLSWFVAEPLVRQACADTDARVHESVVYALCNLGGLNALRVLAELLPGMGNGARMAAAWGLGHSHDVAAVPALEVALRATDYEVRVKALEALGGTGAPSAAAVVRQALWHDPAPEVRYAAALSLLELLNEAAWPDLVAAIAEAHGLVRRALVRGFFHASNYLHLDPTRAPVYPDLLTALATTLEDAAVETRLVALYPLAWMSAEPRARALAEQACAREVDADAREEMTRVTGAYLAAAA